MGNFFEGQSDAKEKYYSIVNRIRDIAESFKNYNHTVYAINNKIEEFHNQETGTPEGIEEARNILQEIEQLINLNLSNELLDTVSVLQTDINFFLIQDFDLKLKDKYLKLKEKRFKLLKKADGIIKKYLNYYSTKDLENLQRKGKKISKVVSKKSDDNLFSKNSFDKHSPNYNETKFHPKKGYSQAEYLDNLPSGKYDQQNQDDNEFLDQTGPSVGRRKKNQIIQDQQLDFKKKNDKSLKNKIKRATTDAKTDMEESIKKSVKKISKSKKKGPKRKTNENIKKKKLVAKRKKKKESE